MKRQKKGSVAGTTDQDGQQIGASNCHPHSTTDGERGQAAAVRIPTDVWSSALAGVEERQTWPGIAGRPSPQQSNRGALCTDQASNRHSPTAEQPNGLPVGSVTIDWLSGTFLGVPIDDALNAVRALFGEITPLDYGFNGYENSGLILAGRGRVAWSDARPDMGVYVNCPASALGELARGCGDVRGWLFDLQDWGFRASRIDVALDDRAGVLDVDVIAGAARSDAYTSRWRQGTVIEGFGSKDGKTIYFGAPSSSARCRIYDKGAEQGVAGDWVRCELQFRKGRAAAVFCRLLDDGPGFVPGLLRGYLEFKTPNRGDTNRRRWPVASWWAAFLGNVEKIALSLPKALRSLNTVRDWVARQVAPSLALLSLAEGGAVDWLYTLLGQGKQRLKRRHLALLPGGCAGLG